MRGFVRIYQRIQERGTVAWGTYGGRSDAGLVDAGSRKLLNYF